jgi:hypothetical protein
MMATLKVALFAEGSNDHSLRGGGNSFATLWQKTLVEALGLRTIDLVFPITKGHLQALQPPAAGLKRVTSSTGVPLDELMRQKLLLHDFDAAVVAWDLYPPWLTVPDEGRCRWAETVRLYQCLAHSQLLPPPWPQRAAERLRSLESRPIPSARAFSPRLERGCVLAVCMEPEFEALLLNEAGVRNTLKLRGKKIKSWPTEWSEVGARRPKSVLNDALMAASKLRPPPAVFRRIPGDMRTAPHAWASYLMTHASPELREHVEQHRISRRLREVLVEWPG